MQHAPTGAPAMSLLQSTKTESPKTQPSESDFHHPPRAAARAALLAELRAFLPADAVLEQEEQVRPYECDGLTVYRQLPLLVSPSR